MDADADPKRDELTRAALRRLQRNAVGGLLAELTPSSLVADPRVVSSKDTAYRKFRNSEDVLRAALAKSCDPEWSGYAQTREKMLGRLDGAVTREQFVEALAANVRQQFRSPGGPTGWLMSAAAMTGSPLWLQATADDDEAYLNDRVPAGDEFRRLADEIREARVRFYEQMTEEFITYLGIGMSVLELRPRPGFSTESIVVLLHALLDGAVMRMYLEPDRLTPELVAEAMVSLGEALGEHGSADATNDPRRASLEHDDSMIGLFDDILITAETLWKHQEVTPDIAAPEGKREASLLMFPSASDLADSLLRKRVFAGKEWAGARARMLDSDTAKSVKFLRSHLLHLAEFASENPRPIEQLQSYPPEIGTSVLGEVEMALEGVLDAAGFRSAVAGIVVADACSGRGDLVEARLDMVEHRLLNSSVGSDAGDRAP